MPKDIDGRSKKEACHANYPFRGNFMNTPTLSVIIPFFNEFSYLERSIGSVLAAGDVVNEILLINDASAPDVVELLRPFERVDKLRVLHNPSNIGASGSRNHGLSEATSDYVLFLDADDLLSPAGLGDVMRFAAQTGAEMIHLPSLVSEPASGIYWKFYRDVGLFARRIPRTDVRQMPQLRFAAANWSFLYSRKLTERARIRFVPELRVAEDHLFIIEALEAADHVALFDRWCHLWRRRGGSLSLARAKMADHRMKLASFEKTLEFMHRHYAVSDHAFQLDYAVGFVRFIYSWDFLYQLLPLRQSNPEALGLLTRLADLAERFPLSQEIANDPMLRQTSHSGLMSVYGTPLEWSILPTVHKTLATRDWEGLEKILLPPTDPANAAPKPLSKCDRPAGDQQLICLPMRRLASRVAGVIDATDLEALTEDTALALVEAAADSGLSLVLCDPVDCLLETYNLLVNGGAGDKRVFSQYLQDELQGILGFPGMVAAAADAAGVALKVKWLAKDTDTLAKNTDTRSLFGLDQPLVLCPVVHSLTCGTDSEAEVKMPADFRMALAEMRDQVRKSLSQDATGTAFDHARRATNAVVVDYWHSDLGDRFPLDASGYEGHVLSKGLLGIAWQLAEQDASTDAKPLRKSEILLMNKLRYGDGTADGRRPLKSIVKHRLRKGWTRVSRIFVAGSARGQNMGLNR